MAPADESRRSVSLFLGRPHSIQNEQSTTFEPLNIPDELLSDPMPLVRPLYTPTKSTFLILHYRLARIIGHIQDRCFGLCPRSYDDVLECEHRLQDFKDDLPPHFQMDNPVRLDGHEWLVTQRNNLISKYHLARISLHRPYLLRSFLGCQEEYMVSREACLFSSIADIQLRTSLNDTDPLDRFKWMTVSFPIPCRSVAVGLRVQVASGFNPATIIGILCVFHYRDPRFEHADLLRLLEKYIAIEKQTVRRDEALENELVVLQMMVERATLPQPQPPVPPLARRASGVVPPPLEISDLGAEYAVFGDMPDDANPMLWAQCLNSLVPQLDETAGFVAVPPPSPYGEYPA